MADELVSIAEKLDPIEANLCKVYLEEAGIESFLYGEDAVGTFSPLTVAGPGVQVMVRAADAARAKAVLAERASSQEIDETEFDGGAEDEE